MRRMTAACAYACCQRACVTRRNTEETPNRGGSVTKSVSHFFAAPKGLRERRLEDENSSQD